MQGFLVLLALAACGLMLVAPILAIVALVRASRLAGELQRLRSDLGTLEARLGALVKKAAAERAAEKPEAVAAAPAPMREDEAPPAGPIAVPGPPPVVPPAGPAVVPPARAAGRAEPSIEPAWPTLEPAQPPVAAGPPPRPPKPAAPPPPPPAVPAFDWESLLGLKGAAWAGGFALVIAAGLFAKLAYDKGYFAWLFTPVVQFMALLVAGVGALVWAELSLRKGYAVTANAVSGAGIATLYIAFFAGHVRWELFPLGVTFLTMALVTFVAGLLAVRYDALFTAILGLLGGFATPVALSTGEDHPIGLFSYILLLDVGLVFVALRRKWHGLVMAALLGTFLMEIGWFGKFMAPEKTLLALLIFLLFGLLYLALPHLVGEESERLTQAGALGGLAPFLFAVLLAGNRRYVGEWPLLFGYLGLLDAALIAVALLRSRLGLLVAGAVATAITLPLWADQGLGPSTLWGPMLSAAALAALLNAPSRLAARFARDVLRASGAALEMAGLCACLGLGLFALVFVARGLGEPPWAFIVLLAAMLALLVERTGERRVAGVAILGSLALAVLIQIWFHKHTLGETLLRNLTIPLLLTIALSLVAAVRARAPVNADEDEAGVIGANLVSLVGLFACLGSHDLGGDPWPLFTALAVMMVLFLTSALRRDWSWLVPLALLSSAAFATAWHHEFFHAADLPVVLPIYAAFYLAFLALPFGVPSSLAPQWKDRPLPWIGSALSGPAFFLVLYDAIVAGGGKDWIGALPVALAALTVAALAGASRRFTARAGDAAAARRRLRYLALFAAVALGFVALAIPLQLDRQWITIGWALEAAAVWWLFARLPHPGLKYFGAMLYVFVGVRLILNVQNVLHYRERGLPILNWLLYTYGLPALCCLVGAAFLKRAEAARTNAPDWDLLAGDRTLLAPAASFLGLILIFALINLEIVDYYSTGRYPEFSLERQLARDLTMSLAWGLYAIALLVTGLWRKVRPLRFISLGFLLLTVAKVFLADLSNLQGVYRILSFLGLGVSLILVSLLYQRFVFTKERPA